MTPQPNKEEPASSEKVWKKIDIDAIDSLGYAPTPEEPRPPYPHR